MTTQKEPERFEVGELIQFTYGEYSSYGLGALGRVLKPFDASEFTAVRGRAHYEYCDLTRLVAEGYIEELPTRELWCGQ